MLTLNDFEPCNGRYFALFHRILVASFDEFEGQLR